MRELNIGIDIDGTVTDPYFWLEDANRYFHRQVTPKDVVYYDIHKVMGVTRADYDEFYDRFGERLHGNSEARPDAAEVLNRLSGEHQIHFVTAREEIMRGVSVEWLQKHGLPMDTITMLGSHHKVNRAKELHCDLFVEDSLNNALELSKAGIEVVLIDCNYNKADLPPGVIRVSNWHQIERIARDISKQREQLQIAM